MKRHRIRLRPKTRRRRRLGLLVFIALAAAPPICHWSSRISSPLRKLPLPQITFLPGMAQVNALDFPGAPSVLGPRLLASIRWKPGDRWGLGRPYRVGRQLREDFPCLISVRVSRSWIKKTVSFEVALRQPLACVIGRGSPAFFDKGGFVFSAPEELFAEDPLPVVSLANGPDAQNLGEVARLILAAQAPGALPGPFKRLSFDPAQDGWSVDLENGTHLLWGDLRWTKPKLARLREVLADAQPRFGWGLIADLRQFEDGKIFVRTK